MPDPREVTEAGNEAAAQECTSEYGGNQCELSAGHTVPHLHWIEGYGDLTWTDEQAQAEHQKTVDYWAERGVVWPLPTDGRTYPVMFTPPATDERGTPEGAALIRAILAEEVQSDGYSYAAFGPVSRASLERIAQTLEMLDPRDMRNNTWVICGGCEAVLDYIPREHGRITFDGLLMIQEAEWKYNGISWDCDACLHERNERHT